MFGSNLEKDFIFPEEKFLFIFSVFFFYMLSKSHFSIRNYPELHPCIRNYFKRQWEVKYYLNIFKFDSATVYENTVTQCVVFYETDSHPQ